MHGYKTLWGTLCVAAATSFGAAAWADESYPSRPVRMVVGFSAGSATDVAARAVAQQLSRQLGQSFIVENRPGASSNIAARAVATAPADGYTVFLGTIANTINASLQPGVSTDLAEEFEPVALVGSVPNLLVVHPSLGVDTVEQLIAKARAEPGKVTYASSGVGTSPHLSGELFASMAEVKMLHVPYKGSSPAVADLLAGQVAVMFGPASTVLPHIRGGTLNALAATSLTRTPAAPDLPTIDELGLKGFETSVWFGLNLPKGTPPAIIQRLEGAVREAQNNEQLKEQFASQGIDVAQAGPAEYDKLIREETAKWARLVQSAGIKVD